MLGLRKGEVAFREYGFLEWLFIRVGDGLVENACDYAHAKGASGRSFENDAVVADGPL